MSREGTQSLDYTAAIKMEATVPIHDWLSHTNKEIIGWVKVQDGGVSDAVQVHFLNQGVNKKTETVVADRAELLAFCRAFVAANEAAEGIHATMVSLRETKKK